MNIESFRTYCLSKPGVTEEFPFDEVTLVFKVGGKIFVLTNVNGFTSANLKCDPERAVELRDQYDGILPGYHMNKKHWNTVLLDNSVPEKLFLELVDHSYDLVFKSLTVKIKNEINTSFS